MRSKKPPPDPPLLKLPLEIIDKIERRIKSRKDRASFATTCKALSKRYYLPLLLARLRRNIVYIKSAGDYKSPTLYCLSDAVEGKLGYAPFFISSAVLSSDRTRILLGITSPEFTRFMEDTPTRSYFFYDVQATLGALAPVTMHEEYTKTLAEIEEGVFATREVDGQFWNEYERVQIRTRAPITRDLKVNTTAVDWKKRIAGKMVPASHQLLAHRFKCRECQGTNDLIVQSDTVDRWPELEHAHRFEPHIDYYGPYGFEVACPRCEGYDLSIGSLSDTIEQQLEEFEASREEASREENFMWRSYRRSPEADDDEEQEDDWE